MPCPPILTGVVIKHQHVAELVRMHDLDVLVGRVSLIYTFIKVILDE